MLSAVRKDKARRIEDYVVGAPSTSAPVQPADSSAETPVWIRDAVEKAVGNAAKEARADLKDVVKTAVEDAVQQTIKTDKKMSGMALVSDMIRNSAKEGAAVAQKESAKYDDDFKRMAGTISQQIDNFISPSSPSSASSSSSSSRASRGRGGPLQKTWVRLASKVLESQDEESAAQREREHAREKAHEAEEYKDEQREYHLLEKGIKHQAQDIRAGHPVEKKKTVPLYDPKAERRADSAASKDLKTLRALLPKKEPMKTFHTSSAEELKKAKDRAKAAALAQSEEKQIEHTTNKVLPGMKSVTLKTARVGDSMKKSKIPISSKRNPKYVRAENHRNEEAQKDFETLKRLRKLQKLVKAKQELERKEQIEGAEDRTVVAEKYLKQMEEKKKTKPKGAAPEHVDRSALAEHYLHRLEKTGKAFFKDSDKKIPPTSRHSPAYKLAQQRRDKEAKRDIRLLNKGVALVKKGTDVVPVKLNPAIVHGVNKVQKEKEELHRNPGPDRNALAQKYLRQLSKQPHQDAHVGKPFHDYTVPSKMLHRPHEDMNAKARKFLKQLRAANPKPPPPPPPPSRSLIAQHDLKNLEHKIGHPPKPKFASHIAADHPITPDTLAEEDLKTLKQYPAPKSNPK